MSRKPTKKYSLRSYLKYFSAYKTRVCITGFIFLLSNVFLAVMPFFIGKLVGSLADSDLRDQAIWYVTVLIIASTGHDILWRAAEILYLKLINPLTYRYENILFDNVMQKPYPYFVDKFSGKLSSYISSITLEMRMLTETAFYNYIGSLVGLIGLAIILANINWQTGLIFCLGLVAMILTGRYAIRNSLLYEKKATDTISTKNGRIIDALANFVSVKSFHKEQTEISRLAQNQETVIGAANKSFFWAVFFWGVMSFFVRNVIWPATIVLNFHLFMRGQVSVEQFATLLTAILMFSSTIWDLIWHLSQYNLRVARTEEAYTYLFDDEVIHDYLATEQKAKPVKFSESLALENLSFAYPDKIEETVLSNVQLHIKKGEKVGIVGKSGSGKTTLTKILLGYYDNYDGEIHIDRTLVSSRDVSALISYVPQDTSLFHRSIADNIAYATSAKVSREDIIKAAGQAHADEFIVKTKRGYDTMVGERGVKLSAGQRQRIAIARAFLDDKPILILDEATSALDSESEVLIQQSLEKLWQGKTVIAIAHRLSTLKNMDRILVVDAGKIIESGSHHSLLRQQGAYYQLWQHQSDGFIEEQ